MAISIAIGVGMAFGMGIIQSIITLIFNIGAVMIVLTQEALMRECLGKAMIGGLEL